MSHCIRHELKLKVRKVHKVRKVNSLQTLKTFYFINLSEMSSVARHERVVGKRSMCAEGTGVSHPGVHGSENAGISNRNWSENLRHRKSKVSWAMAIISGLVGPKARSKGVVDGHTVNIP